MNEFFNIIAWIFGTLSTLLLFGRILGMLTMTEADKLRDKLLRVRRTWPMKWPFVIAVICWAWIISNPLG